jgi:Na+-driven multidrug efflux pump
VTETIGILIAVIPNLWLGIFSRDPAVLATGTLYLQRIGPIYGATGISMLLYFAGQGSGRVTAPFLAGFFRLLFVTVIGWSAVVHFGAGLPALFIIVAVGTLLSTAITAISVSAQLGVRLPILAMSPVTRKPKARTPV